MKARLIRTDPNYLPFYSTVERFLVTGRTKEELDAELERLGIVPSSGLSGGFLHRNTNTVVVDGDWIVDGFQIMSDEEFYKKYDVCRSYVEWDPSDQYGQILQAMHLVLEVEKGDATHTFHGMAWGLFKQTTIRQFFRYPELSKWSPDMASQWEKCGLCTNGKIRLNEEDYKALGKDAYIERFECEEDKTPELASHRFCSACNYIGYKYIGVKK